MSNHTYKKFKKIDLYSDDEDEKKVDRRNLYDKHSEKRLNRALKTKDISLLLDEDEEDYEDYIISLRDGQY